MLNEFTVLNENLDLESDSYPAASLVCVMIDGKV